MNIAELLSQIPPALILGVLLILTVFLLLVPLALKFAGLTGQQIIDVLTLTTRFVVDLIAQFRAQNKS